MANIPVLTDSQMKRLKGILGQRQVIDLTDKAAKPSRLPNMPEEEEIEIPGYNGPFAVISKGNTTFSSGGSTYDAIQVNINAGAISVDENRVYTPSFGNESSFYVLQNNYDLYMEILTPKGELLPVASSFSGVSGTRYAFVSLPHTSSPQYVSGIQYVKLAENRGGKIIQIQHGEISDVPWLYTPKLASSSYKADYASSAGYKGPFHVEIASLEVNASSGGWQGTLQIFDNTDSDAHISFRPSAGRIVQGGTHTIIDGGFEVPFSSPEIGTNTADVNVYLYEDSDGFKYSAIPQGSTFEFPGFYTRLAFLQGGVQLQQTQFGDIVDINAGGTITSNIYTSTVYSSSIYSSSIYSSTIVNSSSIELKYNGHFCVSGGIQSAGTVNEGFYATIYDGTNPNGAVAGEIIVGNTASLAGTSSILCPIGSRVYLIGTVNGNSVSVEYSAYANNPTVQENQFYTQLAINDGGTMIQMQYGDIIQPVKSEEGTGNQGGTGEDVVCIWLGSSYQQSDAIIQAEPNKTYSLYEQHDHSGNNFVFLTDDIETYLNLPRTGDTDDGGDILFKLPSDLEESCIVKVYIWNNTKVAIVAPDGIPIFEEDNNGANENWNLGFEGPRFQFFAYEPSKTGYPNGCWHTMSFA